MNGDWGYCRYCAFEVAARPSGRLLPHSRTHDATTTNSFYPKFVAVECDGSRRMKHVQPGPEATPLVTELPSLADLVEEEDDG